ncbi:uncharacterized protein [Atheta coriaria]|uniref:uncharacterized protein n=1 Tax=Dalotia coriaria TaxID=877792 RepID=UPI0031F3C51B
METEETKNMEMTENINMKTEETKNMEIEETKILETKENITSLGTHALLEIASTTFDQFLPTKSKEQYNRAYASFINWQQKSHPDSFSEKVLVTYFVLLAKKVKPPSLWSTYSMLRSTLELIHNVDISKYVRLRGFLKKQNEGYEPKKTRALTAEQIKEFIATAPDDKYLFTKVGLIFGITGKCRREELLRMEINDVEDLNTELLVHIPDQQTHTERRFVIGSEFYPICKKYMALRIPNTTRFFLNYQNGRCTPQPTGINKFGYISKVVAQFLKLPEPHLYTGRALRKKPSTTLLAGAAADLSTYAEDYMDESSFDYQIESVNVKMENIDSLTNEESTDCDIFSSNPIKTEVPEVTTEVDEVAAEVDEVTTEDTTINFNNHVVQNHVETHQTKSDPFSISFTNCRDLSNISFNFHVQE